METLNITLARKWLDALRSSEYEQTTGLLRDDKGFCCLGVLCDISGLGEWERDEDGDYAFHVPGHVERVFPPDAVDEALGVIARYIGLNGDFSVQMLSSLNDNGKTFPEIADEIQRRLKL